MNYEYQVIPFIASARAGENTAAVAAQQFANLLATMETKGFEYYRMDHYSVVQAPGCLAGLFGAKHESVTYDVAIFRKLGE